jgi:Uma2 family endonuclease
MSYEQYLQWLDPETHAEWVNEKVVFMAPVSDTHSQVGRFLLVLLSHYVEKHQAGQLHYEPFQMKTGPDLPGRSPDILFVAKENSARLKKTYLDGPADLVVEIISPESRSRDRGEKYFEYEKGGVREYWLIDPDRKQAEFYVLGEDALYRPVFTGGSGVYRSTVLEGLWIKVEWLWQRPTLMSVLKEWGLV